MNLFALMRDGAHPIVRIPLSGTAQSDIAKIFKAQEQKFRTKAINKIPFDGKYKPDDDECLTINNYDDIDNLHYAVSNAMGKPEIKASSSDLDNIKALFVGYADGSKKVVLIQSFDR